MLKRFILIAFLFVPPIIAAAMGPETFRTVAGPAGAAVVWTPVAGPMNPGAPLDDVTTPAGLTVHEWGTFTSVAGPFGKAIDWLPAGGPTDLPCFVAKSDPFGPFLKGYSASATQSAGRASQGKVRMETPVLYFYSPREETVNVRVSFPHGLMTEWYPTAKVGPANLVEASKNLAAAMGTIEWNNVKVLPGATESFPLESGASHYYAARRTASAPLEVGAQHEKFLFYRGIASFTPPISAQVSEAGKVVVANLGEAEIPAVILFENRGGKVGYRVLGGLSDSATIDLPAFTSDIASLQHDLENTLRAQGMYAAEARAMVDTWKDTWFEQGTRIFYIVPPRTVDSLLPLEVSPRPAGVARAFVGRMEIITPATQSEVRTAIVKKDQAAMATYGRFLEPILNALTLNARISASERTQATSMMDAIHAEYAAKASACTRGGDSWSR